MNTMFNSFTSILSPALKEKLGIGPKKRMEPKTDEGSTKSPRPLSPHNTTSRQRLSPTLRQLTFFCIEIQSRVQEYFLARSLLYLQPHVKVRGSKSRVHQPADEHNEGKTGEPAVQQGRQLAPGQALQVCHY